MATGWETYPVEFKGGLVTNLGPLQLGINQPGAARRLVNFEPSITGGYRRILGFEKFNPNRIPRFGDSRVQGSGQTGTTLFVANLFAPVPNGAVFSIAGVSGTYQVTASAYDSGLNSGSLTITPNLASSPADKAVLVFEEASSPLNMIAYFNQRVIAARDGVLWEGQTSGDWAKISTPSLGSPAVSGAGQTGATLSVDGFLKSPALGDTFVISGVLKIYTVTDITNLVSGAGTIGVHPNLASSPADDAVITFIGSERSSTFKHRFVRYTFGDTPSLMIVDGQNPPAKYNADGFETVANAPSDIVGAQFVAEFKSHIFLAKGTSIAFSAPFNDTNFNTADGAGVINLAHQVTGLIVFRDQLIVFCRSKIYRILGSSFADFQLIPISLDIGCIEPDSIQEVGGDVAFVAPDGIRLLGGTERIGDFNFGIVSSNIQSEILSLFNSSEALTSLVIRGKNQYRLFGYSSSLSAGLSKGVLGTQFTNPNNPQGNFSWGETLGIKAYVADSQYTALDESEVIVFGNDDGYVYRLEQGNDFDGQTFIATFFTPYWPISDPRIRKTFYKATTYLDPLGSIQGTLSLRYDSNNPGTIQPSSFPLSNQSSDIALWGEVVWGAFKYDRQLETTFNTQVVGSGFTGSLEYTFEGGSPTFSLDSVMIEFQNNDRR